MKSLLTVITPSDTYDLTILATVKSEFGISDSDTSQDENLTRWIHEASANIAGVCKRVFAEEILSEVFRRPDCRVDNLILRPNRRPVSSVTSVTEDGVALTTDEYEVDYATGVIYRLDTTGYRMGWYYCYDRITVVYTAGYFLLNDLPYDIERAAIRLVKHFYSARGSGGSSAGGDLKVVDVPGVVRREWETRSDNFQPNPNAPPSLPSDVMTLLGPYIIPAFY